MHEQTHLLGGQKGAPLMLLPSTAAAEEACSLLLGSSSSAPAAPIRAAAPSVPPSSSFLLDLGCWVEAAFPSSNRTSVPSNPTHPSSATRLLSMGLRLLCHSIGHCLPGCATAIMDIISTRLGVTPEELLHSGTMLEWAPAGLTGGGNVPVGPSSLSLLHMAVWRGDLHLTQALIAWAELHSVRPDWTVTGSSGICPLHLAALLPNAEGMVWGMLELPRPYGPDIAAAWLLCRSSDGRTPAELGSMVGLSASDDSQAHDVLVKAAEEEPSIGIGANLGTMAKPISSASSVSGKAAMMGGLLIGNEGTREVNKQLWRMPASTSDKDTAKGCSAAGADGSAAGANSKGPTGYRSGSNSTASPMPESNRVPYLSNLPFTSLSVLTGCDEAFRKRHLCRLLLLGFPDQSLERRYSQFKVRSVLRDFCFGH